MTGYDNKRLDGRYKKKTVQLHCCTYIRVHRCSCTSTYPRKAVIDLGPKEACTGLTFVCLSRAKRLVDLMVEPMSFDRIGNLGNYV